MPEQDFMNNLRFSKGVNADNDILTISKMLHGCVNCVPSTDVNMDRHGVDYVATLRGGAQVFIDAKTRRESCRRYWRYGEEIPIEIWSVMPGGRFNISPDSAKVGWTLDESKITDLILFTWNKADCEFAYLLCFQTLRIAAARYLEYWANTFDIKVQNSGRWESQAIFVPIQNVLDAMRDVQKMAA
jgi:hypothetical protein